MEYTYAFCDAVNQLYQEADAMAAVAALCYNGVAVHDLEHVHAAHLQSLLQGFATRLRTLARQFEEHTPPEPVHIQDYNALYASIPNGRTP